MKKVERDLKKYYKNILKHDTSLSEIKEQSGFFNHEKKYHFSFKTLALVCSCFVLVVGATTIGIISSKNGKNNVSPVIPANIQLKNSIVEIKNPANLLILTDENGNISSVKGLNEDGALIVFEENLLNKSFIEGLNIVLNRHIDMGFLLKSNSKWNDFDMNIYSNYNDGNIENLTSDINKYFSSCKIDFNESINVASFTSVEKLGNFKNFEEAYTHFNSYNIEGVITSIDILDDFDLLIKRVSSSLAECKALYEVVNNDDLLNVSDEINRASKNFLNGYYNFFIKEDSSYQVQMNKLLTKKKDLLINRFKNESTYDSELSKVNNCISSLNTWKEMINSSLKDRFDEFHSTLLKIDTLQNQNYKDIMSNEDYMIKYQNYCSEYLKTNLNQYKVGRENIYSTLRQTKKDLISFFE